MRATQQRNRAQNQTERALEAEGLAQQRYEEAQIGRQHSEKAEAQAKLDRDEALAQKQRADREAAIAKAVNDFINTDLLEKSDPHDEPDRDLKVSKVLDRALRSIGARFADQPLVEAEIRTTLGTALSGLGRNEESIEQLKVAHAKYKEQLGPEDRSTLRLERQLLWIIAHDRGAFQKTEAEWAKIILTP